MVSGLMVTSRRSDLSENLGQVKPSHVTIPVWRDVHGGSRASPSWPPNPRGQNQARRCGVKAQSGPAG